MAPLSTFSTLHELEYLAASTACSVFLFQRGVLKKDFAQMLCQLEPAICAAAPGRLASLRFPFLRHLAMVDSDTPMGAIETWDAFLARGGGVSLAQIEARAATVYPSDPGVLFFSSGLARRSHLDGKWILLVRQLCHGGRWNALGRRHVGSAADVSA